MEGFYQQDFLLNLKGIKMKYEIETDEKWAMLNALVGIVLRFVPGCVVEIGSSYGDAVREKRKSTTIMGDHAQLFNRIFNTCDIRRVSKMAYEKHRHFGMSSLDFLKIYDEQVKERPAVVFIDGNHDYDFVIQEVKFFFPRLNTGGMIFMHDTMPRKEKALEHAACSDSYRVRQELETWTDVADCFTWFYTAGNCGLTMINKKEENRVYFRK